RRPCALPMVATMTSSVLMSVLPGSCRQVLGVGADQPAVAVLADLRGGVADRLAGGAELGERVAQPVGPGVPLQCVQERGAHLVEGGADLVVVDGGDLRGKKVGGVAHVLLTVGGHLTG